MTPLTGELPVYITENGSSWYDYVTQDGRIEDYERAEGYAKRFGLVYVDFATQQRILKRSGELYAAVTRANALPAE